jgi:hypothetical protein
MSDLRGPASKPPEQRQRRGSQQIVAVALVKHTASGPSAGARHLPVGTKWRFTLRSPSREQAIAQAFDWLLHDEPEENVNSWEVEE